MVPYGNLALTVSSPQLLPDEPITLAEGKELARIEHSEEDGLIASMITSARVAAEYETGIQLAVKQWDLTLDYFPGLSIELPVPLQSVDRVQYRDSGGNTIVLSEGTDYIVDLARGVICPPFSMYWPSFTSYPSGGVLIRFRSGYPATHPFWSNEGQAIMTGIKFLITDWWGVRDVAIARGAQEIPYRVKYLFGLIARQRAR